MHDWPPYGALGVCVVAVGIVLILCGLGDGLNPSVPRLAGGLALIVGGLLPFHGDD